MNFNNRYIAFDLLRGAAALLVCAGHIRNFLFVDFAEIINPQFIDRLFYFLTSLGHQAVVIFFVMSGYFVGGSVWNRLNADNFSWKDYAVTRLTRLWLVLIPALAATLILDYLGKFITDGAGYDGRWIGLLSSGPGIDVNIIDLSSLTFLGNVFFLQTVAVPVFGSNGPLWSLANEFWYYLAFPCIAIALHKSTPRAWLILIGLLILFIWFPTAIFEGFVFWIFGSLVAIATGRVIRGSSLWPVIMGISLFVVALAGSKFLIGFKGDLTVAAASAILLLVSPSIKISNRLVIRSASMLSDMSYTLYLFHFPFAAFFWFTFIAPTQLQPNVVSYIGYFVLLTFTLIFCLLMWWLFERNTNRLRIVLTSKL